MSKIGADARAKLEEKESYKALGIMELAEGGYAIVSLKISGTEVLSRTVVRKADKLAGALQEYQIESGKFGMEVLDKGMK